MSPGDKYLRGTRFWYRGLSLLTALVLAGAGSSSVAADSDASATPDLILKAMTDELAREKKQLKLPGKPQPYFIRYEVVEARNHSVTYELGTKCADSENNGRTATIDLRVGNYEFDNAIRLDSDKIRPPTRAMPIENDYAAVRRQLWILTDEAYKTATEQLERAQSFKHGHELRHTCESFSHEPSHNFMQPLKPSWSMSNQWNERVKVASEVFADYPEIRSAYITLETRSGTRRVVNTEGTAARFQRDSIEIGIVAYARTPDGVDTWDCDYFSAEREKDVPDLKQLAWACTRMAQALSAESKADRIDHYYGPVLFESPAAAEVVQHGLGPLLCAIPGDNINPSRTLIRDLNMRILPDHISVTDDPTLEYFKESPIAGHGLIDSDGIAPSKVNLVDHGFLKEFISGRTPVIPGQHSNGHNYVEEPTPTTLVLTAHKPISPASMRAKLFKLAKDRGLKEAIIVRRMVPDNANVVNGAASDARSDGLTNRLAEIFAVNVETGQERRIRGLRMDGFNRPTMDSLVAAGDDSKAHMTSNWRGNLRSIVSPSLLIDNIELEEDAGDSLSPYPIGRPPLTLKKAASEESPQSVVPKSK